MKYKATITIECNERDDLEGAIYAAAGTLMDLSKLATLKRSLGGEHDWSALNETSRYSKDDPDALPLVKEYLKGVIETKFHYEEIEEC